MDGKIKELSASPPATIGLGRDVQSLKEHGSESVAELREFLKTLKARNPKEVIGIVSSSMLIQSFVMSCVITIVFMALFTVGPYYVYGPTKPRSAAAKPAANPTKNPAVDNSSPAENAPVGTKSTDGGPDAEKASKVMGLDEAKPADPKRNPLDKPDFDKLLDGL